MSLPIEDYALIGDCESAALVARNGSIDWLCWPRFDSGACFAALLGTAEHGRWRIAPASEPSRVKRRYRQGTLILETEFQTPNGIVAIVDFMPPRGNRSDLVRLVFGRQGRVRMQSQLGVRYEYGSVTPWIRRLGDGRLSAVAGPDMVVLKSDVSLSVDGTQIASDFEVDGGDCVAFVLTHGSSHLPAPESPDSTTALKDTEQFWQGWSSRCQYEGPWSDIVLRSHIVLKALTYAPTGGIVAAPTTSLPEHIGGTRNWDYRYCWLRDATFTLLSLLSAGYMDEARAWRDWLLRAVAGAASEAQIMYTVDGSRRIQEWKADWLPGYADSRPVRIGNEAATQIQLDVYGEVMDALHQARCAGLGVDESGWQLQRGLMEHLETVWQQPDRGIWEMRGTSLHYTHSKVMAWVAFDRAVRAIEQFGMTGPLERWRQARRAIHDEVCTYGFDAELGSFVQSYGSKQLDASLLLLPLVGFLPAHDRRIQGTISAIERRLVRDAFVLRYDTGGVDDGLPPGEGAFLACSFWLVDNWILQGRHDEARGLFERLIAIRNDVGLLAEEYDPHTKRQLGNFPQAFSHIAMADTARNLTQIHGPARKRGQA